MRDGHSEARNHLNTSPFCFVDRSIISFMQPYTMIPYSLSEDENDFSSLESASQDENPLRRFPKLGFWIEVRGGNRSYSSTFLPF